MLVLTNRSITQETNIRQSLNSLGKDFIAATDYIERNKNPERAAKCCHFVSFLNKSRPIHSTSRKKFWKAKELWLIFKNFHNKYI